MKTLPYNYTLNTLFLWLSGIEWFQNCATNKIQRPCFGHLRRWGQFQSYKVVNINVAWTCWAKWICISTINTAPSIGKIEVDRELHAYKQADGWQTQTKMPSSADLDTYTRAYSHTHTHTLWIVQTTNFFSSYVYLSVFSCNFHIVTKIVTVTKSEFTKTTVSIATVSITQSMQVSNVKVRGAIPTLFQKLVPYSAYNFIKYGYALGHFYWQLLIFISSHTFISHKIIINKNNSLSKGV